MPKKLSTNSKAEAARSRKAATDAERKDREKRDKEDLYWQQAEGRKSRASKKREEDAEKRTETANRKAETRRLAEEEEKSMEKSLKNNNKSNRVSIPVPKVTEVQLLFRREQRDAEIAQRSEEAKRKQSRSAAEEEYERLVVVENTNRDDSVIDARTVDDAIAEMSTIDPLPLDKHPERRLKASFKVFEEAELSKLKQEKPGLTYTQYKDFIWKLWKKSPDNPLNQVTSFFSFFYYFLLSHHSSNFYYNNYG